MESEYPTYSRLNRYQKKRKNTRWLLFFAIAGFALAVCLVVVLALSGSNEEAAHRDPDVTTEDSDTESPAEDEGDHGEQNLDTSDQLSDEDEEPDLEQPVEQDPDDFVLETVASSDENVMYAYTSTWEPIPTVQEEPHEMTWEQSSVDWKEMMKAAELATGVNVDEMYYLWVSGNGPQSVIATFSNSAMDEHFRVYITWVEGQGWRPDQVDILYEHDQMHRFQPSSSEE